MKSSSLKELLAWCQHWIAFLQYLVKLSKHGDIHWPSNPTGWYNPGGPLLRPQWADEPGGAYEKADLGSVAPARSLRVCISVSAQVCCCSDTGPRELLPKVPFGSDCQEEIHSRLKPTIHLSIIEAKVLWSNTYPCSVRHSNSFSSLLGGKKEKGVLITKPLKWFHYSQWVSSHALKNRTLEKFLYPRTRKQEGSLMHCL